jgi:plastocyanin
MPNYLYASRFFIAVAVAAAGLAGLGCTDNSGNGPGNPGTAGSSAGSAGTMGTGGGSAGTTGAGGTSSGGSGGSGGAGGTPGFMSVLPCTSESQYVAGTTISFPTSPTDFSYSPKCLKVPAGTTVTFSGDFGTHPLSPSSHRGAQTGNPITLTSSVPDGGTTKDFTFTTPGFYAYFCTEHDTLDTGMFMDGVVWVQ